MPGAPPSGRISLPRDSAFRLGDEWAMIRLFGLRRLVPRFAANAGGTAIRYADCNIDAERVNAFHEGAPWS
jgi:hypothetical protein